MDPATMINNNNNNNNNNNEASAVNHHHHRHSATVAASYNLSDIWEQFPLTVNGGGVEESGPVLSARRGHFVSNLGGFVENRDILVDEGMIAKQKNGELVAIKRRDVVVVEDESTNHLSPNSSNEMNDNNKRLKALGDENIDPKATEMDANSVAGNKPADQPSEPPKQGYIHVRARRGQATDSHSLAERARREKISERMKILQDLVPGCNKVIGKAMVLDEIINYIQSLQRQVEFLSMKLEAVSSRMTPGIDGFPPKDFGAPIYEAAGMTFGAQAPKEYSSGSPPEWLHMQVGGSFERPT